MNIHYVLRFAALAILLSGCSLKTTDTHIVQQRELLWRQHHNQISALSHWKLTGRLGIVSRKNSGTVTLYWEQHPVDFSMRIVAPLGRGVMNIRSAGSQIILQDANGESLVAGSVEELIWQRTGWLIPVSDLQKWALGLMDYQEASEYTLDEQGRLEMLLSAGWDIRYQRYRNYQGVFLPQKIHMQNDELTLKLVITRWEVL